MNERGKAGPVVARFRGRSRFAQAGIGRFRVEAASVLSNQSFPG